MRAADLVGTWRLVSWTSHRSDGDTPQPFGGAPSTGLIIYSPDGHISATLMQAERPPLGRKVRKQGDVSDVSDEAMRDAFTGYVAYAGTYSFDEEASEVTHHVEFALYPDWIGGGLVRIASMEDDRLVLRTRPVTLDGGAEYYGELVWEHAGTP